MRVIIIDAKEKRVYEKEIENGLKQLQDIVGGYIEIAHRFDNSNDDVIFVNEEGLFEPAPRNYFMFFGAHQPFAGNGVICGDGVGTNLSVREIESKVKFLTEEQIQLFFGGIK